MKTACVALLLVALLSGCGDVDNVAESALCGQFNAATYHVPGPWPCWKLATGGDCVVTSRPDVDACTVPDSSDEMFAGGDVATMWCGLLEGTDADRNLIPVFCTTGDPVYP